MTSRLLLTSFDTWKPHQASNSSDDLIGEIIARHLIDSNCHFLRKIVVDFQIAPAYVIHSIETLNPDIILCCGMAERRQELSIESNGKGETGVLTTSLDLPQLLSGTIATKISHDAGKFVCNHVYYSVLKHIQDNNLNTHCLFVHVPLLNEHNLESVVQDFLIIMKSCKSFVSQYVSQ